MLLIPQPVKAENRYTLHCKTYVFARVLNSLVVVLRIRNYVFAGIISDRVLTNHIARSMPTVILLISYNRLYKK